MLHHYSQIQKDIDALITFLNEIGIAADFKSHLENDFLIASEFLGDYAKGNQSKLTDEGRAAVGGLHELYKWIWSIKDCDEFDVLIPHLEMLSQSATRINSKTPMISPVTGKQDDKTNKLIETIIAMFAVKVGANIDLDDPFSSNGGANPDIIFTYKNKRISIACKTLRGNSESTILSNLRSAAKQIERADCEIGYIAINAMNILPHNTISDNVYLDLQMPFYELTVDLLRTYNSLPENAATELAEIFSSPKVKPVLVTFVHSNTKISSMAGNVSTMIKATFVTKLMAIDGVDFDMQFLEMINEFIHQRL